MTFVLTNTETGETQEVVVCDRDGLVHSAAFFCPLDHGDD